MKRLMFCACAGVLTLALSGCVGVLPTVGGTAGGVYTDVTTPLLATSNTGSSKVGQAESTGIICIAIGDSSIKAAADKAGITKIHHADTHVISVLGVYSKVVTTVYGE